MLAEFDLANAVIAASRRYGLNATRRYQKWAREQLADPGMGNVRMRLYELFYERDIVRGKPPGRPRTCGLW